MNWDMVCLGAVTLFVLITGLPTLPDAFSMVLSAIFVFDVSGFNRGLDFFLWACGVVNKIMFIRQKCFIENERRKSMLLFGGEFVFCFVLFFCLLEDG